jgi:hypothetical protein
LVLGGGFSDDLLQAEKKKIGNKNMARMDFSGFIKLIYS